MKVDVKRAQALQKVEESARANMESIRNTALQIGMQVGALSMMKVILKTAKDETKTVEERLNEIITSCEENIKSVEAQMAKDRAEAKAKAEKENIEVANENN